MCELYVAHVSATLC